MSNRPEPMFPILGDPIIKAIPWAVIRPHETQAQRNHGQTLNRLAQRGGLSPVEAICVMRNENWTRYRLGWARAALLAAVWKFEVAQEAKPEEPVS